MLASLGERVPPEAQETAEYDGCEPYNDMHDECEGDSFIAQKNDAIDANNEQREEPKQMALTGSPRLLCRNS